MTRWGMLAVVCVTMTACGDGSETATDLQNKVLETALSTRLDDQNVFEATLSGSPLKLETFGAKLSLVRIGDPASDSIGEYRKIDIKAGDTTLNLSAGAENLFQGASIVLYHWHGEPEVPVYNPREAPYDDSAYAVVAYSESRRHSVEQDGDKDWFTLRTDNGIVRIEAFDPADDGGIKGTVRFDVILTDPDEPIPAVYDGLPHVSFEGRFNVRVQGGIDQTFFQ